MKPGAKRDRLPETREVVSSFFWEILVRSAYLRKVAWEPFDASTGRFLLQFKCTGQNGVLTQKAHLLRNQIFRETERLRLTVGGTRLGWRIDDVVEVNLYPNIRRVNVMFLVQQDLGPTLVSGESITPGKFEVYIARRDSPYVLRG